MGIEAGSTAPGIVNICTGHGGKREGAGRPALPGDEIRKNRSVKFSDAEWEVVKEKARIEKMAVSEYIRNKVLE